MKEGPPDIAASMCEWRTGPIPAPTLGRTQYLLISVGLMVDLFFSTGPMWRNVFEHDDELVIHPGEQQVHRGEPHQALLIPIDAWILVPPPSIVERVEAFIAIVNPGEREEKP